MVTDAITLRLGAHAQRNAARGGCDKQAATKRGKAGLLYSIAKVDLEHAQRAHRLCRVVCD